MKKTLTLSFLGMFAAFSYGAQSAVEQANSAYVDGQAATTYYQETHRNEPKDLRRIKVQKPLGQDDGQTVTVNLNDEAAQLRREAAYNFDTQSPTKLKGQTGLAKDYTYEKNGQKTAMTGISGVPPVSEAVDVTYEGENYAKEKKAHLKDYKPENTWTGDSKSQLEEARQRFRKSMEEQRRRREQEEREMNERNRQRREQARRDELKRLEEQAREKERINLGENTADEQLLMYAREEEAQIENSQPPQKKRKGAWRTPKSTGPAPIAPKHEEPTLPHTTYEEVFVGTTDPEFLHNFISQYLSPIAADDFAATVHAAVYEPQQPPQLSGFFVPENILRDAIGNYERDLRQRKRQEEERQQKEKQRKEQLHRDSVASNHAGLNKIFGSDIDKNGNYRYECTRTNQLSSDYNCSRCCKLRETDYASDAWPDGFNPNIHHMVEGQLGGSDVCWCYWEAKVPPACDPKIKLASDDNCTKCCDALLDADASLRPSWVDRSHYAAHFGKVQGNECLCNFETLEAKQAREEEARQQEEERIRRQEEWSRQRQREIEEERAERDREWERRRQENERLQREEEDRRRRQREEEDRLEEQARQRRIEQEQREWEERREQERLERERIDEENRQRRAWEEQVENMRGRMSAEELEEWIRRNIPW